MPLRFVSYTRVGMQRAGLLVAASLAAEDRQPADVDRVAARTASLLQRAAPVPTAVREDVEQYLSSLRLWNRYRRLQGRPLTAEDVLEVQDLWLADPTMPSATGALTPENASEMPQLAVSLRLLREGNFTRTDRGRALIAAIGDERITALRKGYLTPNPLRLPAGAQLLILSAFIEADGDFLQSIWRTSPAIDAESFSACRVRKRARHSLRGSNRPRPSPGTLGRRPSDPRSRSAVGAGRCAGAQVWIGLGRRSSAGPDGDAAAGAHDRPGHDRPA